MRLFYLPDFTKARKKENIDRNLAEETLFKIL